MKSPWRNQMTNERKVTNDEREVIERVFPEEIGDYHRIFSIFSEEAYKKLKRIKPTYEDIRKLAEDFLQGLQKLHRLREETGLFIPYELDKHHNDGGASNIFLQRDINGYPFRVLPNSIQLRNKEGVLDKRNRYSIFNFIRTNAKSS